jgi:hypothetical protein
MAELIDKKFQKKVRWFLVSKSVLKNESNPLRSRPIFIIRV